MGSKCICSICLIAILFVSCKVNGVRDSFSSDLDSVSFEMQIPHKNNIILLGKNDLSGNSIVEGTGNYYFPVKLDSIFVKYSLFDTGADVCAISTANGTKTGIGSIKYMDINQRVFNTDRVLIDSIVIGHTKIHFEEDEPFLKLVHSEDSCLIGGSVLGRFAWKIDNLRKRIYFSSSSACLGIPEPSVCLPMKIVNHEAFIELLINNEHVWAMLDSGAEGFFLNLSKESYQAIAHGAEKSVSFTDLQVAGDSLIKKKIEYLITDVSAGSMLFENEILQQNFPSNLLGMDFFSRFEYIILDYPNKQLFLGPTHGKTVVYQNMLSMAFNSLGIRFGVTDGQVIISSVSDSLSGNGISLCDTVVSIGSQMMSSILEENKVSTLSTLPQVMDSIRICLRKGKALKELKLYRRNMIKEPDTLYSFNSLPTMAFRKYMYLQIDSVKGGELIRIFPEQVPSISQ